MKFSIGDVFEVTETYNGKSVLSNEEVTIPELSLIHISEPTRRS